MIHVCLVPHGQSDNLDEHTEYAIPGHTDDNPGLTAPWSTCCASAAVKSLNSAPLPPERREDRGGIPAPCSRSSISNSRSGISLLAPAQTP
ncbi:unnamed protein product [Pleuronectes platessa]|uniref:Uncharacterized protein n=1 Tax=Pleuronectes platessa TaxID=8262 RepID=A0A9N7YL78_PLEPL|nr:unnamed protein product [Pleuronectes platessa]